MIPNLVTRLSGFLLLIFYTRFLSPAEYGVVELVIVLFSLLNLVLPLEITQGVARHFSEANQEEKDKIVSTSILFHYSSFFFTNSICFDISRTYFILNFRWHS